MNHTPGPWRITEIGKQRLYVEGFEGGLPDEWHRATCTLCAEIQTDDSSDFEKDKANAELIVKAPTLQKQVNQLKVSIQAALDCGHAGLLDDMIQILEKDLKTIFTQE